MSLKTFIEERVAKIAPLEQVSRQAWWDLAVTGDEIHEKKMQEANIALRKIYASQDDYHYLKAQPPAADLVLNRQKKLLLCDYQENQITHDIIEKTVSLESEIESIYTKFRPKIGEKTFSNNDLKEVLVNSLDVTERQAAWEASKLIGEKVEKQVLDLIALRNSSAKKVGFDNFYTMKLELQELDEVKLFKILAQLDELTRPLWNNYKKSLDKDLCQRFNLSEQELKPWHYHDPFFQEAPQHEEGFSEIYKNIDVAEASRLFYKKIGLDVDDILMRSDLYEREKKNQHAFCTCIDRKQDCRILCNLRNNEYWMSVQLHELGHAVYDKNIDQDLPFLLRTYAHISTTEAIAMLFGRVSKEVEFLQGYCSIDVEQAQKLSKRAQREQAINLLVFARWVLVMVHFERALYQGSGKNLNETWWDYVEQFQMVKRVSGRNKPDWAAKLHLACAPVYYQNYILGEMMASQIKQAFKESLKNRQSELYQNAEIGNFLKEKLFKWGACYPWDETVRLATGKELDPLYFINDIKNIE